MILLSHKCFSEGMGWCCCYARRFSSKQLLARHCSACCVAEGPVIIISPRYPAPGIWGMSLCVPQNGDSHFFCPCSIQEDDACFKVRHREELLSGQGNEKHIAKKAQGAKGDAVLTLRTCNIYSTENEAAEDTQCNPVSCKHRISKAGFGVFGLVSCSCIP